MIKTDRKAEKSYRKMPEFYRRRIFELGKVLAVKPVPVRDYDITKLSGMEDTYRVRIGDIRVSYVVFWQAQEIHIFEIKWRGKAYK